MESWQMSLRLPQPPPRMLLIRLSEPFSSGLVGIRPATDFAGDVGQADPEEEAGGVAGGHEVIVAMSAGGLSVQTHSGRDCCAARALWITRFHQDREVAVRW